MACLCGRDSDRGMSYSNKNEHHLSTVNSNKQIKMHARPLTLSFLFKSMYKVQWQQIVSM